MEKTKMMDIGTATLGLAASITDRAHDLIQDGWVKGSFRGGEGGVETFCILGALDLALEELLGNDRSQWLVKNELRQTASMFILDEAMDLTRTRQDSIPCFNDAAERQLDEVLGVLGRAAKRLWDLSVEQEGPAWTPSKWADVDVNSEPAQQYLNAVLA